MAANWTAFKLPNGATGYTMPNPSGGGYLYHGPDGLVYPTSGPGKQENPGTQTIGNTTEPQYANPKATPAKTTNPTVATATANPYQPTYLGNPTMGTATTTTAAALPQDLMSSLGSNATIADLQQSFVPQTNVANQNLQAQLAAAGISGGAGIDAGTQLSAQLQAAQDPALAAAIQNSQANQLSAGEYNASNQQQAGLANQSAANSMTDTNLAALLSSQFQNANYANTGQTNYANALLQAYQNQQNQFNAINTQGLAGQQGVTSATQSGANQLATGSTAQNYGTSSGGSGYQSLAGALGNIYGTGGQTQQAQQNSGYYGATDYGNGDSSAG